MSSIVVVGLEPLGLSVVRYLASHGKTLTCIAPAPDIAIHQHELRTLGVRTVVASSTSATPILADMMDSVSLMILTEDRDGVNVDLALRIRKSRKDLPLIVRVFDQTLAEYLRTTVDHVTVLSIAALAAPEFVKLALQALAEPRPIATSGPPRRVPRPKLLARPLIDRVLVSALVCHLLLIVGATVYFSHALALPLLDALYFVATTVTTVGYGDISVREASVQAKVVDMFLMFTGAAFVAVLFAIFTGWVVDRRLDALQGRVPVSGKGHVIVVGAGNVGFRVAVQLTEQNHRVVIIERGVGRNTAALRASGHHVIVGDGASEAMLHLAGLSRAGVLLALADSDAINLEIVLKTRQLASHVPIVARFASAELSSHTSERGHALTASSVEIASTQIAEIVLRVTGWA